MTDNTKLMNLIGLAQRAGKLETGTDFTVKAITNGHARLVILASDASDNLTKKITDKAAFYHATVITPLTEEEISIAIGHKRTVIAILDAGFAKAIAKLT
ncbi:YlxQ-related RNA-binding protein [Lacticaseibacillus hulanensis]|uniref:YlxQ-related RNA-binding protein n=1 Tax=Lacticaseibacillus hulanensis TaxID=2493111 RepID=UPI000FDAF4D1|nr:YlxQ-related RNA-binding protein [Lacticaseibacillus hulanensis]